MAKPALKETLFDELMALPEHHIGEIIHNILYSQPRPAPKHARAFSVLGGKLGDSFDWGGGDDNDEWWIFSEPELHIDGHILVPDIAGWQRERMPSLPETAWFDLAPDWVCEILSPSTAQKDRMVKMPVYAELGVKHLWLIDPEIKTLEVYQLENQRWSLMASLSEDDMVSAVPFDAIEFNLDNLWA
ncbi:MAG TPA: Uma2 family endonuclease [Leucothrix mucor]|nr:Uma2 family endonuclease [Leucothrix mucor]